MRDQLGRLEVRVQALQDLAKNTESPKDPQAQGRPKALTEMP